VRAYLGAAYGSFDSAERLARSVLAPASDPEMRARAAITLGSILRQTGRHAEACKIEKDALRRASDKESVAHLRVGLAADFAGLGDLGAVDRHLGRGWSDRRLGWRVAVRLRWVRCERELLAEQPGRAAAWARRALTISRRADAVRHEAKSLLFLGAASAEVAYRATAAERAKALAETDTSLRRARAIAARIGALPIERAAGDLLDRR
jgi:hypothetical protein